MDFLPFLTVCIEPLLISDAIDRICPILVCQDSRIAVVLFGLDVFASLILPLSEDFRPRFKSIKSI